MQYQPDDDDQHRNEQANHQQTNDDEVQWIAVREITAAILAALHAEHRGGDTRHRLPQRDPLERVIRFRLFSFHGGLLSRARLALNRRIPEEHTSELPSLMRIPYSAF